MKEEVLMMGRKITIICSLGAVIGAVTCYSLWKQRRLKEEIQRREKDLQILSEKMWERRLFWLKVSTVCIGLGGTVYFVKKLAKEAKSMMI